MNTLTVEVTQADREAAAALDDALGFLTEVERPIVEQALAAHRLASQPDDLTAAAQLQRSGLITPEKYNHICENIRARQAVREAMA